MFLDRYWSHIQAFQKLPIHVCWWISITYSSFSRSYWRIVVFSAPIFSMFSNCSISQILRFPKTISSKSESCFSWIIWRYFVFPTMKICFGIGIDIFVLLRWGWRQRFPSEQKVATIVSEVLIVATFGRFLSEPRHVTKVVAVRAVNFSTGRCWPEFRCEQLCDEDIFLGAGPNLWFFTKRVTVRAVNFSIGVFCTEFRCEQLCNDDILWIGLHFLHLFCNSKRFSEPRAKKASQKPESWSRKSLEVDSVSCLHF